ncbi:MAG: GNAT family N-acetyltransferase [Polyangiaceae bacterium]
MSNAPVIRRATPADIPAVAKLAAGLVRYHHHLDAKRFFLEEPVEEGYAWWLSREIQNEGAVLLVAEESDGDGESPRIIGYAYGRLEERDWTALLDACGMLHDLYVSEDARTHGVGGALVEAMVAEMTALGAPRLVLTTATQNEKAQRLFKKLGFRVTMLEMTREVGDKGT